METFENYLQDCAVEDSPEMMGGGSDGHQKGCERWIENLDIEDVMAYAEYYGKKMYQEGIKKGYIDGKLQGRSDLKNEILPDIKDLGDILEGKLVKY